MIHTVIVDVTAADIAAGDRDDANACPVARAAGRAFGCVAVVNRTIALVPSVWVVWRDGLQGFPGGWQIQLLERVGPKSWHYLSAVMPLPGWVRNILDWYAVSGEMTPFRFELSLALSERRAS